MCGPSGSSVLKARTFETPSDWQPGLVPSRPGGTASARERAVKHVRAYSGSGRLPL
jgi:hypothetical protein